MHSSISNSESNAGQRLQRLRWVWILSTALLLLIGYVTATESMLGRNGYSHEVTDSEARWQAERAKISPLGSGGLALIGASRIQLGLDMDTLRNELKLQPIQLAIDGNSFWPVLKNLAEDRNFTGTVFVDFYFEHLTQYASPGGLGEIYNRNREKSEKTFWVDYSWAESRLGDVFRAKLLNYTAGGRPLDTLLLRVFVKKKEPFYLETRPDRSRIADYSKTNSKGLYYNLINRQLNKGAGKDFPTSTDDALLRRRILAIQNLPLDSINGAVSELTVMVRDIESRSGKVIFSIMPMSGMVREIEERRYPPAQFIARLRESTGAMVIDFREHPELSGFKCPDGSHLDVRDRIAFTRMLIAVLSKTNKSGTL